MCKISTLVLTSFILAAVAAAPAMAQERHGGERHVEEHHGEEARWHGDIHHFHEHDFDRWRGGSWYHGFHEGRGGWWWIIGDSWYFYPAPVYPYPDPYIPPTVTAEPVPVSPVGVAPAYVYYCHNPIGYYPYVEQCYGAWERVASAATVQPAQPLAVPPPVTGGLSQRDSDDRQLNSYAVALDRIDLTQPHAIKALKELEGQVKAFREALYTRTYNAMDILHDAERLQQRIEKERQAYAKVRHSASP